MRPADQNVLTPANLSGGEESTLATRRAVKVLVKKGGAFTGLIVRRGLRENRTFTSIHRDSLRVNLASTDHTELRLAPDNPFLAPNQLARAGFKTQLI